jgi:hypothetical protein
MTRLLELDFEPGGLILVGVEDALRGEFARVDPGSG